MPEELAGGMIQCPRCGRLNDVPTLSDLPNLEEGGAFKLADPVAEPEAHRLQNLKTAFTRSHTSDDGREIDLRPTMEDVARVGATDEIALASDGTTPTKAPKYDPITGELVRPLAVKPVVGAAPVAAIPLATAAASPEDESEAPRSLIVMLAELLNPVNLIAMAFILIMYLAAQFFQVFAVPLAQMTVGNADTVLVLPMIPLLALLLSHYANVIEETGPLGKDDLPRPLRSADFGDDLWRPLIRMTAAILLCYWPVIALGFVPAVKITWQVKLLLVGVGTWAMPAAALTATSGGTLFNLRPDRLLSVITACGGRYIVAVALWMAAVPAFLLSIAVMSLSPDAATSVADLALRRLSEHKVFYPLLCLSIYLMHAACAYLGMLYRRHSEDFGWAYQRHVHVPREGDSAARLHK